MSVRERDPLTGHETTGHEWDGITELNTRVPAAIWWFIGITHVWAVFYWILMPSWPLITTYTPGILGFDEKTHLDDQIVRQRAARAVWTGPMESLPVDAIRADPDLMDAVNRTAPALFGDNCAGCHGKNAAGGPGFPSLVDDAWLWGGDSDAIMETLRVGINSEHPDTRFAQMLAFGRDQILSRDEIRTVAEYVRFLGGAAIPDEPRDAGAEIYAENCSSCHGEDGRGSVELGAPNLTDSFWIYGGDDENLFETIHDGRQGWMPAFEQRLGLGERKLLTVYLQDLAGEHPE